mgnify:FL=1
MQVHNKFEEEDPQWFETWTKLVLGFLKKFQDDLIQKYKDQ